MASPDFSSAPTSSGSTGDPYGITPGYYGGGSTTTGVSGSPDFSNAPTTSSEVDDKKKKHHGLFDRIAHDVYKVGKTTVQVEGNLAKGLGETVLGIGPGIAKMGLAGALDAYDVERHPLNPHTGHHLGDIGTGIVKQYKDYYGHDTLHHLKEHPEQVALDALTAFTLGLSGAAKVAEAAGSEGRIAQLGERGTVTTRSPRNIASGGTEGPVQTELTSDKPLTKLRQQATNAKQRTSADADTTTRRAKAGKVLGIGSEPKQFGKGIRSQVDQDTYAQLGSHAAYRNVIKGLSEDEQTALNLRSYDVKPDDLQEYWQGTPDADILTPKVMHLMENPTPKMVTAEVGTRGISLAGENLLKQYGQLGEDPAAARPGLPKRIVSEALGRDLEPLHGDPYYTPHVTSEIKAGNPMQASGGGRGVPKEVGSTRRNEGVLLKTGQLLLQGDLLGPEFLRRLKFVRYDMTHDHLLNSAVRMTKDQIHANNGIPKDWEYVPKKPYTITRTRQVPVESDQLPLPGMTGDTETVTDRIRMNPRPTHTMKQENPELTKLSDLIPDPSDLQSSPLTEHGFGTRNIDHAHEDSTGHYYIVPKELTRAATGEYTRMSDFAYRWMRKPLSIWRALVLGSRPAFLVNNLVGNSLMYMVRHGGTGALRDLLSALRESHGDKFVMQALEDGSLSPALRQDLYSEFFGEQGHGTMGRTQSPLTGDAAKRAATKAGRAFDTTFGAVPRLTSKVAEESLRKGAVRNLIRRSPEFKQVYQSMPKETRKFEAAARQLLEHPERGPAYRRLISKQVDETLGNYRNLTHTEQTYLRNLAPFYSWYKAIATTSFHLLVDSPVRAHALYTLGQIGQQWTNDVYGKDALPSFLLGAIPLGKGANGTLRALATQGLNPWASLEQLRRGSTSDVSALGLNPFLQGALNIYDRHNGKVSPARFLSGTLAGIIKSLPPAQMLPHTFQPGPSELYPNRGTQSFWEGWAGAPIKEFSPTKAQEDQEAGQ